jgi:UPF0042 nucleotide-binding protein
MRFIVITGTSGAGKATAFNYFEDRGYFAVDNLPPRLLPELAASCLQEGCDRALAVVDSRAGKSLQELPDALNELNKAGIRALVIYIDASDETLVRRFKETRRTHPTFEAGQGTILAAIQAEREMLAEIQPRADKIIDTSNRKPADLRAELADLIGESPGPGLAITVESFGFRHGLPIDADLVFDVRFLANPHYVPELKPLTGQYPEVSTYIHGDSLTEPFLEKLFDFVSFSLPQYQREGKAYLTIAIGCTGGRHRSVLVAEELAENLRGQGYRVAVHHRDVKRDPARYGEVSP